MKSNYLRNVLLTCSSTLALAALTTTPLLAASTSELEQQVATKSSKKKIMPSGFSEGTEAFLKSINWNGHDVIESQSAIAKKVQPGVESGEALLHKHSENFYGGVSYATGSLWGYLLKETGLANFVETVRDKRAADLFALEASVFAKKPESKELPEKSLALSENGEMSGEILKSRSQIEIELMTTLKEWIDSKLNQNSINSLEGRDLSSSLLLVMKTNLNDVSKATQTLVREQALNAFYIMMAGNAIVEKIKMDIDRLIEIAHEIIEPFLSYKEEKRKQGLALNSVEETKSYEETFATLTKNVDKKLDLFSSEQTRISSEMDQLKKILRPADQYKGWIPTHSIFSTIGYKVGFSSHPRLLLAVAHVNPLITPKIAKETFEIFKPTVTAFDTGLEEMIFGKEAEIKVAEAKAEEQNLKEAAALQQPSASITQSLSGLLVEQTLTNGSTGDLPKNEEDESSSLIIGALLSENSDVDAKKGD